MEDHQKFWYVLQLKDQTCEVATFNSPQTKTPQTKLWGSFSSKEKAIAKKIGLIRAGKCKPLQ